MRLDVRILDERMRDRLPQYATGGSAGLDLRAALDALVSRGITPFVALTFFPAAVSAGPVLPPPDGYAAWQRLVRGFLDAVVARFGAAAVGRWWFEAWNEPNMPPFWGGSFDRYLDLYRATSRAVRDGGHRVRLGGPVVAYTEGADALVERFLAFLAQPAQLDAFAKGGSVVPARTDAKLDQNDFASVQLELVRASAGSSQFYDRDTNPDMAQQGMKGFQEFLARPDRADAILDRHEATRERVFK